MIPILWGFGPRWGSYERAKSKKPNYAWAFPVFRSKNVNLGRDVTMGTEEDTAVWR